MLVVWRLRLAASILILGIASAELAHAERSHEVLEGQTLWSIAYSYGLRVEDLTRLNRIDDPTELEAGHILRLPNEAGTAIAPGVQLNPGPASLQLSWPIRGLLTSRYGRRGRGNHSGIDVAAAKGTIIVAAAAGTVVRGGDSWGRYGRVVLIEHPGGYSTLYSHLSRSFVSPGDRVERGQAIAAVGQSGNATGPHLHFEVWLGTRTDNPLRYLRPDVRLTAELR